MKNNIEAKVYRSFEELASLQPRWDSLAESVASEVFLTYDWCRIWWKYYGKNRDLRVWVFQKGPDLVGIVPLFFERIWLGPVSVRAVKLVSSDHTMAQFSLPIVSEHIADVIEGLSESILKEEWDVMHIGPIAGLYGHYETLREAVTAAFGAVCGVSCKDKQVQTYFFVADTWDAHLDSLSKNARRSIKRKYKALEEALQNRPGELTSNFAGSQNADEFFLGFVQMHQKHWQEKGMPGHFGDWPDSFDFHKEMIHAQLPHDRLRLMQIHWGDCCLAYEYAYKFGDRYLAFLNSRTNLEGLAELGVGTIIFAEQIKKAIEEKVRSIDDMRAKYDYKLRMGGQLFPMRDIYIFRREPLRLARVYVFRLLSKILHLCYYKIWYIRIAQRLPLRRRPLWRMWIRSNAFAQ